MATQADGAARSECERGARKATFRTPPDRSPAESTGTTVGFSSSRKGIDISRGPVVNSLYAFSCEINTNYACGCSCINLSGEDSRINYYWVLRLLASRFYVFPYPESGQKDCTIVAEAPVLPVGYVVSASRIADRRMMLAGYRLADLLTRAVGLRKNPRWVAA